jgi:ParB family chromosome partitioning protein
VPPENKGIGRGLAAILPRTPTDSEGLRELPIELIKPNPSQPRRDFADDPLAALAASIEARGVLQPIVVRPLAGGTYELVAGERRVRAAEAAGLDKIPALVRDTAESERLELALIENMARQDLNPIEEARACALLVEDLGISKAEAGRRVGRSRAAISNLIRLLELPDEALDLIESGHLTEAHGRALLLCKDHAARRRLALSARDGSWSVRETEERARLEQAGSRRPSPKGVIHPDLEEALAAAEDALSAALGIEVKMRPRGESCRAEIAFDTPAEAVALAEKLLAGGPLESGHLRAISSAG